MCLIQMRRWRSILYGALAVASLVMSSVDGFCSSNALQGKGSAAYVLNSSCSQCPKRTSSRTRSCWQRPNSHLFLFHHNPAQMMAKLSSDIFSSVESYLESPDFNSMFLAMDDTTVWSIVMYTFVFWIGMFVAVSTNDISKTSSSSNNRRRMPDETNQYAKYTRVTTNSQTAWNMEHDRRKQQQQQQPQQPQQQQQQYSQYYNNNYNNFKRKDDQVAAIWKKRDALRTVITYERGGVAPSPAAVILPQQQQQPATLPPTAATVSPSMIVPPSPAVSPPSVTPTPPTLSPPTRMPATVARAPAMTSAQYMAGLGSTSTGKRSYAVPGPKYSTTASSYQTTKSYRMTQWTPDTPVAITSLYLANMSGPNRPVLGGESYQVPVYFSPQVIPERYVAPKEESYYHSDYQVEQPQQQEWEEYNEEYDDYDNDYDIPQGKGSGYQRSYAPTRWRPDMRVNHSGPSVNAYLSNMRQQQPRMTQPASYHVLDKTNNDDGSATSELSASSNGAVNGVLGNTVVPTRRESMVAPTPTAIPEPPAPALHSTSLFTAADNGPSAQVTTTKKSYSMTAWKPGSPTTTSSTFGHTYLAKISAKTVGAETLATSVTDQSVLSADAATSVTDQSSRPTTVAETPATSVADQSSRPSADDVSPLLDEPPAPVSYQTSFTTTPLASSRTRFNKSYKVNKWQPGSLALTNSSFGNTYLSSIASKTEPAGDESPVYQPPAQPPTHANIESFVDEAMSKGTHSVSTSDSGSVFGTSVVTGVSAPYHESPPHTPHVQNLSISSTGAEGMLIQDSSTALESFSFVDLAGMNSLSPDHSSPPTIHEPPAPTPTFISMPAAYYSYATPKKSSSSMNGWKHTRPLSDSIIGNAYFSGMGSLYGSTEAPRSSPPLYEQPSPDKMRYDSGRSEADEDWPCPPVWGVAETPKRIQQMQMQE